MNVDHPEFQNAIASIRVSFVASLEGHLENLISLSNRIINGELDGVVITKISEIAHKIRGVAKTLQFEELGLIADRVEMALEAIQLNGIETPQVDAVATDIADLIVCITEIREDA